MEQMYVQIIKTNNRKFLFNDVSEKQKSRVDFCLKKREHNDDTKKQRLGRGRAGVRRQGAD